MGSNGILACKSFRERDREKKDCLGHEPAKRRTSLLARAQTSGAVGCRLSYTLELLNHATIRLSFSILATASPKFSLVVFEPDCDRLPACWRARYSALSRATRRLAASALALMRSRVSCEYLLRSIMGIPVENEAATAVRSCIQWRYRWALAKNVAYTTMSSLRVGLHTLPVDISSSYLYVLQIGTLKTHLMNQVYPFASHF